MSDISRKKTSLILPISLTPTDRRLTLMTTRWNSSLFIDDDIPVLGVVLDALAKDQLIYVVLYVATNDSQHWSCRTQYNIICLFLMTSS